MVMIIKQINRTDLPIVYNFQKQYTNEQNSYLYWLKKYNKRPELFIGCYQGEKIIGICVGRTRGHRIILTSIAVDKHHQRKGIGKTLMNHFEKQARMIGKKAVGVAAYYNVIEFYKKLGYKDAKRVHPPKSCIVLEKAIKKAAPPGA